MKTASITTGAIAVAFLLPQAGGPLPKGCDFNASSVVFRCGYLDLQPNQVAPLYTVPSGMTLLVTNAEWWDEQDADLVEVTSTGTQIKRTQTMLQGFRAVEDHNESLHCRVGIHFKAGSQVCLREIPGIGVIQGEYSIVGYLVVSHPFPDCPCFSPVDVVDACGTSTFTNTTPHDTDGKAYNVLYPIPAGKTLVLTDFEWHTDGASSPAHVSLKLAQLPVSTGSTTLLRGMNLAEGGGSTNPNVQSPVQSSSFHSLVGVYLDGPSDLIIDSGVIASGDYAIIGYLK